MADGIMPRPRTKAIKLTSWIMALLFGAGLLVTIGTPLASPLFPEEEVITCTVKNYFFARAPPRHLSTH